MERISEAEAIRDLAAVLRLVESGKEVVIERDLRPLAVIRPAAEVGGAGRAISECVALAEQHERETGSRPVLDDDFAEDLAKIIESREPRGVAVDLRWNRCGVATSRL